MRLSLEETEEGTRRHRLQCAMRKLEGCAYKPGTPRIPAGHQWLDAGPGKGASLELLGESDLLRLWFQTLASRTVREHISITLSYPVCGNLFWQPQEATPGCIWITRQQPEQPLCALPWAGQATVTQAHWCWSQPPEAVWQRANQLPLKRPHSLKLGDHRLNHGPNSDFSYFPDS